MKTIWKISIAIFVILVVVLGFFYNDTFKETVGSLKVENTNLSKLSYDKMSLGNKFEDDSAYVKQRGDTTKLSDYNYHGMNASYVTTNSDNQIVGLKLLDKAAGCRSYFSNGLAMDMALNKVKRILGNNYFTLNTDRYGKVAMYIDKKHNYKLLLGLSENNKVTAIILFNNGQYDYQY